jgi:hypothetical protein
MANKYTVPRQCLHCGGHFLARADLVEAGLARWCSRRCAGLDRVFARKPLAERFWAKVNKDGPVPLHRPDLGPCWLWIGAADAKGYGKVAAGAREEGMQLAHRVAFFLAEGRWPEPCALHHCDNPPCVRREHLFEGTYADNMADCAAKGRVVAPALKGELNPYAKLTERDVRAIRARRAAGETQPALAAAYGITQSAVSAIERRRAWPHI